MQISKIHKKRKSEHKVYYY